MTKTFDKLSFVDNNGDKTTYRVQDSDAARKVSDFQTAQERVNISSGDEYNVIYSKLSKWYTDFKPVVFSGSYNDLEDKPVIPTINDGILNIKVNNVLLSSFSANAANNTEANITVPVIDDVNAANDKLFSSKHILNLLRNLPAPTVDGTTINSIINSVINNITEQIEGGEITVPSPEQQPINLDIFDDSIESNAKTWHSATIASKIKNGKLTIKVNGYNALTYNGTPVAYYSANQQEDYELNLTIPDFLLDDTASGNNVLWSSSKVISYVDSHSSFRTEVVQNLPDEGEANVLYLVVKTANGQYDTHDEYIWINNTWENIGKQVVDMSSFNYRAGSDKVVIDNSARTIDIDPTKLPQPIQYSGERGIIVNNDTHVISLEEGIIPQKPETPNNYYQYNNLNIVVPQGRGIIRLAHDYIMPSGANPSVYERGVYIEDVTIPVPPTAQELEYMNIMVQYPVNDGPENAPSFANVYSHYAPSSGYSYNHPQQFRVPINAKGSIVRDANNYNQYYYDEILRNGDFCYDNVGNLFTIDNLKSDIAGSGNWIEFNIVPKLRAYYNDDYVSNDMFTTKHFESSDYSSNYSSEEDYNNVYAHSSELNGSTYGNLPHSTNSYQYSYRFISAYKNPETEKVFYVYGSPDESVALACYMREMDNNNIRPAFAGFLLFGTPWSLEPPIERNDTELEIAASTWIEPRPQIFFIEASSINNNVSNIDTTNLQENDIVVIKNPSTSISYQDGNDTITISDLSFEPQFRYDGTGFKPMFRIDVKSYWDEY